MRSAHRVLRVFDADIAIVGGGLTGTALALALRHSGWRIALLEAGAPFAAPQEAPDRSFAVGDFDTRVSALTLRTQRLLQQLEVWPALSQGRLCAYQHMTVWDADGTGAIDFDASEVGAEALGFLVENSRIQRALNAALTGSGIDVRWQHPVAACERDAAGQLVLQLAYGGDLRCRLVVAADGGRSPLRAAMGFATREWSYDQHAIVATVRTSQPHCDTAWQRFLPSGPLAFLPLGGADATHTSSIVWSVDSPLAPDLLAADDASFARHLEAAFERRLGAVEAVGPRQGFPLRQCHAVDYVQPGFALLGDAAHAIHPLAGQGVNLGFADVSVLAEELQWAAGRRLLPGDMAVLSRYQRRRKTENLLMMAAMEGYKRLFAQRALPIRWLRNLGLRGVDGLPPIKHAMMRHAMGVD